MSFVNSSLLNTGVVSSNPGSEAIPAGQSGDLNQEFSKMLQYLRHGQDSKEQEQPNQGISKESLSKEYSLSPEAPMKNLLGFLEAFEGQVGNDFGPKLTEANVTLATVPVVDKLTALAKFLSVLQEKLTEGPGTGVENVVEQAEVNMGDLDLDELAGLLQEVKAFFDQVTDLSQLPISSAEIKALSLASDGVDVLEDGNTIVTSDASDLNSDDRSDPLAVPEVKVDEGPEKKSQSMIAKGLSIAFSQLQALVSRVKLASKNNNGEVIASNPDAGKVTDLLGTLKGIDLSKFFTNSDKSTATVDIELNGTNPPTIDEFMTILNKVKSENDSLAPIKPAEVAQVPVAKEIASEGARTLALPMRTSDVVFAYESDIASVPIKNLPQALRKTSIPLEQLSGETNTADLSNIKANVSGQHPLTPVITPVSVATEKPETVSLELTEADVEAAPVRDLLSKPDEKTVVKLDQVLVHGENVVPKKTLVQTIETELVTVVKTAETISSKLLEDFEAQGIKPLSKVVENSVQSVPVSDIPKIKVDAEMVKVPIDRAIQLTDETAATIAKLNLDLSTENNKIAVPDGAVGAAELTASGKVVKSDINAKVVKSDMTAQQKSLPNDISLKESNIGQAPKMTRVAIADVSEFKPEVAAQKPEAKISSSQDKHITDNILKDNSNLEKGFSKMAATKQVVLGRKVMETQVADRFNIQPPKMRPLSTAQNTALDSKSVTDFVARTAQAFVSQQQGIMRKKLTGDTPDASNTVGVNTDAPSYQQIAASSGSQSQTGQGSGGSNMLEKWADTHLDLSSRGWATNMAKTMVSALNRGQERLMFSLSPPSLGRISIAFTSTRGALDVRIQAERKATIALLGDAEGKLTSNLESAGHRVNSLSYAEMNSGETKFDFDHNQSSNNESKGKGKRDSSQAEKPAKLEAEAESSVVSNKKADDSLVNITV
jgi:hypothetical protein